jgi:ATP-dependent Lhr-like helicase
VTLLARDLPAPSPLAMESSTPAPTPSSTTRRWKNAARRPCINRRWTDPASTDDLGALDAGAIASVAEEAWPQCAQQPTRCTRR